jgi:hypothetical protein
MTIHDGSFQIPVPLKNDSPKSPTSAIEAAVKAA